VSSSLSSPSLLLLLPPAAAALPFSFFAGDG
jgi:hypothetical protein